ncbi:hypothetical protein CcaverHIS002_0205650 [Cutaneotrichosporon cavernicola]|nr:hypothetical protein CcaverHIS002_0205650 [Cutaneotrichosporon cavernicola]
MVPQEELPVLESFINIRNRLTALKKDSTRFIRAQDVLSIYKEIVKQLAKLTDIREERTEGSSSLNTPIPGGFEPNRVDTIIADVFSLISLMFLTVGKSRESPAIYGQIASMRQILTHLDESGIYTEAFATLSSTIVTSSSTPEAVIKYMSWKLDGNEAILKTLMESLGVLNVELVPIHNRLVALRKQLIALASQPKVPKAELKPIVEELRKIDSKRVDGKFLGPGGSSVPEGQALLGGLIDSCFEIVQDIKAREAEDEVSPPLRPIYERLSQLVQQLEQLTHTHRWTLRETDLYNYLLQLREVDSKRVDGKFVNAAGEKAQGQYVLLYLLRRCYGLIYRLMAESEPISEELVPVANKLSTIKKCLNEVLKYGGPYSPRDLYPYHMALHQIDSLRKDGKFLADDGSVPEGQAILNAQLSEAHELLEMLKESMSDDDDDSDD